MFASYPSVFGAGKFPVEYLAQASTVSKIKKAATIT
jgi:hypothetical protein